MDSLTNIYNQRSMYDFLKRELALAKRHESKLSIIYFDVDNFKAINDKQGHIKGDEVLKTIGLILLKNTRDTDIPCRHGGDEFCLILPDCDLDSAKLICKKIIKDFNSRYQSFSLSFGVAQAGPDNYDIEGQDLIREADQHMYKAKNIKGNAIDS